MNTSTTPPVDQEIGRRHLELANRHVAEGQKRVDAQITLVVKLDRDGHDTRQAKKLLEQFEQILALQIEHRNRIVQELGADG